MPHRRVEQWLECGAGCSFSWRPGSRFGPGPVGLECRHPTVADQSHIIGALDRPGDCFLTRLELTWGSSACR